MRFLAQEQQPPKDPRTPTGYGSSSEHSYEEEEKIYEKNLEILDELLYKYQVKLPEKLTVDYLQTLPPELITAIINTLDAEDLEQLYSGSEETESVKKTNDLHSMYESMGLKPGDELVLWTPRKDAYHIKFQQNEDGSVGATVTMMEHSFTYGPAQYYQSLDDGSKVIPGDATVLFSPTKVANAHAVLGFTRTLIASELLKRRAFDSIKSKHVRVACVKNPYHK